MKPTVQGIVVALALLVSLPAEAHSSRGRGPTGTVWVQNRAGVPVTVSVEGGGSRTIAAYQTEAFRAEYGMSWVHASVRMYDQTVMLLDRQVRVRSYGQSFVQVDAPSVGRVEVINETGRPSEVFVDGREVAELGAGAARILTLPFGKAEFSVVAGGLEVQSACLDVRPFTERVIVARAPTVADLVVQNPLPIAVDVRLDSGSVRRLGAGARMVFPSVGVGARQITASRVGGGIFSVERAMVSPWTGGMLSVDAPNTGLVQLSSHDDDVVRVFADGRLVATVAPGQDALVEVPLGATTLEVRKLDGCLVERAFVDPDPFRTSRVSFGRYDDGQHRPDDRQGRDERDQRDDRYDRDGRDDERDEEPRRHEPATW